MGGVVEGGVGITDKTSPRRAAIEKVQAELRQEYAFREKRKGELEFLEKGGDPLEYFKDRNAVSVSVQSPSFTDQHPDQFVSEAKGSFALTASPHGDSVGSSGRLGANPCEPNSADNLMLFDADHEIFEGNRNSLHPSRSDIVPSKRLSQMDGNQRTQEHGDSATFCLPRKAYKRRFRSRTNRDGTRSSSTDINPTCGSHGSSLPSHHGSTEVKELVSGAENQNVSSNFNSKPTSPRDDTLHKIGSMEDKQGLELSGGKASESTKDLVDGVPMDTASEAIASETVVDDQHTQQSHSSAEKIPIQMNSDGPEAIRAVEETSSEVIERQPSVTAVKDQSSVTAVKDENPSGSCHMNGFNSQKGEQMKNDNLNSSASQGVKGLDPESSCTQTSLIVDGNEDSEMCIKMRNADSNGKIKDQALVLDETPVVEGDEFMKENKETGGVDHSTQVNLENTSACLSHVENGFKLLPEEALSRSGSAVKTEVKDQFVNKETEACDPTGSDSGRKPSEILDGNHRAYNENIGNLSHQDSIDIPISDLQDGGTVNLEAQTSSGPDTELARKTDEDEDSILKEAQIIEAKRKRMVELSFATSPKQIRPKSHWDYVLEEMLWLANDFAQERVWKITAAAQISSRAALSCQLRKRRSFLTMEAKKVAHTLSKSIMDFWQSVEDTSKVLKQQTQKDGSPSLKDYAVRFLEFNRRIIVHNQAEVPLGPDILIDSGMLDLSLEDNLTEENLFYTVPPGAMETYKNSIELYVSQCETIRSTVQEEVETSVCDASADFESQDNVYDEDEGETNTYDMPTAFEGSKSSRSGQKKRKHLTHAYGVRSYDVSSDVMAMQYAENKVLTQQSALLAKRPGGSLNISIPTKRVRTASRRIISPFSAGTAACIQVPIKTDASSGDANSFQDDQSTPFGGSIPNSLEVESVGDFEKQLPFDSIEVSTRHKKKKKKAKHLNVAYEPQWQHDSTFHNEQFQRDHLRKSHQLDSNGNSGLLSQPVIKKLKTMRQSKDNSFENITPTGGSVPSPVASQVSNMPNQNKFMKIFGGRDRGRKPKVLKMPAVLPGSGSPWTLFEDQALVVLAHDLGPNWELVSDAINSTMQFKCIFRKAKECRERHNFLMDRTSGDGADSAEDSGSSQPYPSALPGIPKGSARQLFQRLQGPVEEDTVKNRFEKIIIIGQKQHYCRTQDLKQRQQPHSSHMIALSHVCSNSLSGGHILTPLDLCDAAIDGSDILSVGYQGSHSGGLAIPKQATSGATSVSQGSPNMMLGSNFSSSPGSHNTSVRDGRYGVPRSASFSADEQQRMQQYNQMMSSRNMPQPNISSPGSLSGSDHGVRVRPGGNGMGLVCGVSRSVPMARPGFQGIGSSSIVNPGNMGSPGMPSANMHSGAASGQGSSILRHREALHVMRPGLVQDSPKQIMVPDLQMQASPGNSQGVSHFGGLSPPWDQTASPPVSSYPLHHQPSHPISPQQPQVLSPHNPRIQGPTNQTSNPQQQAYAICLAKERQQHRFLQQQPLQHPQQPQFAASSSLMPHVQSQPQLPISSPLQNISQGQPQTGSPPVSLPQLASVSSINSMPQHQQKHQMPTPGVAWNAQTGGSGLTNQTSKQRQRQQQQFSQANRQHPQQWQQQQAQQPSKVAKGVGRGNQMIHQNIPIEPLSVNGVSTNQGNQWSEKGEAATHPVQSQGLYTGSSSNAVQPTKQYVSSQSSNQSLTQKNISSGQTPSSTKHIHQMNSHSDNSSQNAVPAVASGLSAVHQSISSLAIAGSNPHLAPSSQKPLNPNQSALQRGVQQNRQINSDPINKPLARDLDTNHHPSSSSTAIDATATLPQATNSATSVVPVSPDSTHQLHASEPLLDTHVSNSARNLSSLVSVPSNSTEPAPLVGQGLGQRLSSASLTSIRHDANPQWQQQPSQLQQPSSPVPQPQQHHQPMPPLYSQKQTHLLQAGNGNLYGKASENRLE